MFKSLSLKVIIFGFIFTFFSSFGQSFFLGLFNSSIRDALSITQGQFGSIYASATLLSSFLLIWVGKKIDDINIFKFAFFVTLLLSFSCFFFSKISSITFLFIAIFLMRFSRQGMMSHTATTTISRYFTKSRGKALSTSLVWSFNSRIYTASTDSIFIDYYFLAKYLDLNLNICFNIFTNNFFYFN